MNMSSFLKRYMYLPVVSTLFHFTYTKCQLATNLVVSEKIEVLRIVFKSQNMYTISFPACCSDQPSYLISAPNRWIHDRSETICVDLYNVRQRMTITLSLETVWIGRSWRPLPPGTRNETVATTTLSISRSGMWNSAV